MDNLKNHPYMGLSDNRDSLTRYPVVRSNVDGVVFEHAPKNVIMTVLPREWVEQFVAAGGSLDVNGVYGVSPYTEYTNPLEYNPAMCGRLLQEEAHARWENVWMLLRECKNADITIDATINIHQLRQLAQAALRLTLLREVGSGWSKSFFNLGKLPVDKFVDYVLATATKAEVEHYFCLKNGRLTGIATHLDRNRSLEVCIPPTTSDKYSRFVNACVISAQRHQAKVDRCSNSSRRSESKGADYNFSVKAATYFLGKCCYRTGYDFTYTYTSNNSYAWYSATTPGVIAINGKLYHSRVIAGYNCIQFVITKKHKSNRASHRPTGTKTMWYVWAVGDTFRQHVEGNDLRATIKRAMERTAISGNVLSLTQVINARSLCINGSKEWLSSNCPHIYNLLRPYTKWSDVPQEIMSIKWELIPQLRNALGGWLS